MTPTLYYTIGAALGLITAAYSARLLQEEPTATAEEIPFVVVIPGLLIGVLWPLLLGAVVIAAPFWLVAKLALKGDRS